MNWSKIGNSIWSWHMEALLDQKESQLLSITRERGIRNDPDDEKHVLELHHLRCQKKVGWIIIFTRPLTHRVRGWVYKSKICPGGSMISNMTWTWTWTWTSWTWTNKDWDQRDRVLTAYCNFFVGTTGPLRGDIMLHNSWEPKNIPLQEPAHVQSQYGEQLVTSSTLAWVSEEITWNRNQLHF